LVQDGIAMAATLLASAEARGKKVSAGNVNYYATRLLRQGRRSGGESRTDVMSPGTQITGRCRVVSMEEPVAGEAEGDDMCLHDVLAARNGDPATAATRRLDWAPLVTALEGPVRDVLSCLLQGQDLTVLVPRLKRSRSSLQQDKERLGRLVREHLGPDILEQVQQQPRWRDNVQANREKAACRYERLPV
jgi:hypothetical protein